MRGALRQMAHDAIVAAATLAGNNVFLPRDWPTNSAKMPNVSIQTPREDKANRTGRNGPPFFRTTSWLQLRVQVSGGDPAQVESDLETLVDQVEAAVMGLIILPPQQFEQIVQGQYEMTLSAEADKHYGEAVLLFGFEYPERFAAVLTAELDGLDVTVADGPVLTLATAAPTANGSAVLNFGSVPPAIVPGLTLADATTGGVIPPGSEVQSVTATTVTMTKTAIGGGVLAGDVIQFAGALLAEDTIDLPT